MIPASTASFGAPLTFTPTVTTTSSTSTPTGTVTFYNSSASLGTGIVGSNGIATFTSSTLTAGLYSVTAQYSGDSANQASTSLAQPLTISKATPVITWAAPAAIIYGTLLGAAQLDATANVPGTFVYSPAAGAILMAGPEILSATFTPTDAIDYATADANVPLTVNKAGSSITWVTREKQIAGWNH